MTTSSLSYFSNAFPTETTINDGNIFRADASPILPIGSRFMRADGNVYRYAKMDGAKTLGYLMAPDHSATFMKDSDDVFTCGTAAANSGDGLIGSHYVQLTKASVTKNQFMGGYLVITGNTGIGYTYRIDSNTATDTPSSGEFRMKLHEPLQVGLDATSDCAIIGSLYNNLVYADSKVVDDNIVSGVGIATTTASLMWAYVQTWGVCAVYMGTAVTGSAGSLCTRIGDQISLYGSTGAPSGSTGYAVTWPPNLSGTVGLNTLTSNYFNGTYPLGFCLDIGDAGGMTTIYLQISA